MADGARRSGDWLRGVIAHRGTPRSFAGNTLPGVAEAVRLGAAAVEVDVRTAKDGVPVLHHGPALGGHGVLPGRRRTDVAELTADEIRRRAPHVPTLAEALALTRPAGVPLVLDIGTIEAARACLAELRGGPPGVPAAWFCGAPGALAWVRAQDGAFPLLMSWAGRRPPADHLVAEVGPTMFNPAHRRVTPAQVDHWHDRGIGVCAWTVDRSRRRARLRRWGVDAVISNDVARAVREWSSPRGDDGRP